MRYSEKISPGYEDGKNKTGMQKYGDLLSILWRALIMKVKRMCLVYLCIFAMLISVVFPSGVEVKAKELGKGGDNSFIEEGGENNNGN